MTASDGRKGRPWRRLRAQVLLEEPVCYRCGCAPSTTVDHAVPLSRRPDLAHTRANLRGCCLRCNLTKGDRMPTTSRSIVTQQSCLRW